MSVMASRKVTYEPLEQEPLLSTVRNVEVAAVGIEYPLASGPATFTTDHLLAAVASQDDPAIPAPRVWLGHVDDDRFHTGRATPAGSAEPALGKIVNMRVEDEGMTLVGDIVGVPTWLAKILASAYPNRSIEGYFGATTVTDHQWDLVITDLALLGVTWPGVTTLEDLESLYSEDGPDGIEVEEADLMTVQASRALTGQVNVDDVRKSFFGKVSDLGLSTWSWIRAMLQEPDELIVDDEEGGLFRVPYSIKGEDIEFSDPVQVKIQYVNASQRKDPAARGLLVNMLTANHKVVASWDQRAESRPESNNQEVGMNPEMVKLLRAKLGLSEEQLPDDATQDQINAALAEAPAPQAAPDPGQTPESPSAPATTPSGSQTPPVETPPETSPVEEPVAASHGVPEGHVSVPKEAWEAVQANAAAGAKVATETEKQRRDGIVASAVKQGRIAPSQRDTFTTMFEKDPKGTENLLTASVEQGGLLPGTIPVEARGADPDAANTTQSEAYPSSWLPELQQRDSQITVEG